MKNEARKLPPAHHPESYKPANVADALKLLHSKWRTEQLKEEQSMEARSIKKEAFDVFAVKATGSMKDFELGKDVRRAWKEVTQNLAAQGVKWSETQIGYVLIPQPHILTDGKMQLRVGVNAGAAEGIPEGVERLHIPARTYATVAVRGNREKMNRAYAYINEWMEREGYEMDTGDGVFGMEPNRLFPVNPFDLPADEIDTFDYDIMIAVKD